MSGRSNRLATAALVVVALFGIAACGNSSSVTPETGAGTEGTTTPTNTTPTPPPAALQVADLFTAEDMAFGEQVVVRGATIVFDACGETDDAASWDGEADPLGSIVCGGTYDVTVDMVEGKWVVSGPQEGAATAGQPPAITVSAYPFARPPESIVSVWGAPFVRSPDGLLYRVGQDTAVGRISLK